MFTQQLRQLEDSFDKTLCALDFDKSENLDKVYLLAKFQRYLDKLLKLNHELKGMK